MGEVQKTGAQAHSLDRLFRPRSIALVGATDRSLWSLAAFDNLRRFGFKGRIIPVNPKGGVIHGLPAAVSCAAAGEEIDAALLMVPEAGLLDSIADLGASGVGGAVILSAGFAEVGADGAKRQQALTDAAKAAGVRLIGPNCLGFANFVDNTPICTTPLRRPPPNPTMALVSQSGAIASQLQLFSYQQRVSFTHMVSTGNEADVDVADVIDYLVINSPARAIALFLETVRHPERFAKAIAAAGAAGKAVVVLKVGSSEAAAKAAQTHTGSLVGDDNVFSALSRRLGMTRVKSLEDLIITADIFGRLGPIEPSGLALMCGSGGLCEIATDQAEAEGMPLPALSQKTLDAMQERLPTYAQAANPLDVTGAVMVDSAIISDALAIASEDENIGLVAYVFDAPARDDERGSARKLISAIGEGLKRSKKPGLMISNAFTGVTAEGRALVDEYGIVYSGGGLGHVLSAIIRLFRWSEGRASFGIRPITTPRAKARPKTERETLDHLATYGVPVIPATIATSAEAAIAAARGANGPVVLKIASEDIQHKSDVGGVALNLSGDDAVRKAYDDMRARVAREAPKAKIDGVIVSPMRAGGLELLVGVLRDPQWGPVITVGLGGVFVEALRDTSLRLLPIDERDALQMLDELRGKALLDGFRGSAAVDRVKLAKAIVAIGEAALALGPELVSLEINPLLASGDRIEALDGLTSWEENHERA